MSRKIMYAVCLFTFIYWIVCLRTIKWSTEEHPFWPPAYALVIVICFYLSRWWFFRKLSQHCIPGWCLFHFIIFLFVFSHYRVLYCPLLPSSRGCLWLCRYSQSWIWAVVYLLFASMKIAFWILSRPMLFLVSVLCLPFLCCWVCFWHCRLCSVVTSRPFLHIWLFFCVHMWYPYLPSWTWYRSSK